jgi:hypothetical protein
MLPEEERSQAALITFLRTDLDLCATILETARLTDDRGHFDAALDRVQHGIATVRTLMGRLQDRDEWALIRGRADSLETQVLELRSS